MVFRATNIMDCNLLCHGWPRVGVRLADIAWVRGRAILVLLKIMHGGSDIMREIVWSFASGI
jgi:hypothetical protein